MKNTGLDETTPDPFDSLNFILSFYRNAIFEDYIYDSLLDENMDDFDEDAYLERLARMKP